MKLYFTHNKLLLTMFQHKGFFNQTGRLFVVLFILMFFFTFKM